jgi:hypothetical protein
MTEEPRPEPAMKAAMDRIVAYLSRASGEPGELAPLVDDVRARLEAQDRSGGSRRRPPVPPLR